MTGSIKIRLDGHSKAVLTLAFSPFSNGRRPAPEERLLVSGGEDKSIRVWRWKKKLQIRTLLVH